MVEESKIIDFTTWLSFHHHVATPRKSSLPTQKDVARLVGISRETVSQILHGKERHRYNEETRRRVLAACEKLGYRPHRGAQSMRKGRSNLIGILHFNAIHHLARQTATFLPSEVHKRGYETFVIDLSWQNESYRRAVEQLIEMRIEGVLVSNPVIGFGEETLKLLSRAGIPTVLLSASKRFPVPTVRSDSQSATEQLVRLLYQNGRRKLWLLASQDESPASQRRIAGFSNALEELSGVEGRVVRLSTFWELPDPGMAVALRVKELLGNSEIPDAILCNNDYWARGVFSALIEAGISIPGQVAVTGFDNAPFGELAPYYLTTVAHDMQGKCQRAVEILMGLMEGVPPAEMHHVFPCEVIVRQSCGSPAAMVNP